MVKFELNMSVENEENKHKEMENERRPAEHTVKRPCHFCHFSLSILFLSTISYFHFFVAPIEVGQTILIHSISISQSPKMTSLFCPGKRILFSVTEE